MSDQPKPDLLKDTYDRAARRRLNAPALAVSTELGRLASDMRFLASYETPDPEFESLAAARLVLQARRAAAALEGLASGGFSTRVEALTEPHEEILGASADTSSARDALLRIAAALAHGAAS